MPECTVSADENYYLPVIVVPTGDLGDGIVTRLKVFGQFSGSPKDGLWGKTPSPRRSNTYIKRSGTWVVVDGVDAQDIRDGSRILLGGYETVVTGQDLFDMVTDGALTSTQACGAEVAPGSLGPGATLEIG